MKKLAWSFLLFGLLATGDPLRTQDGSFQVVVNSSNSVSSMPAKDVSRLFLKKLHRWPNGFGAIPVDQTAESPSRRAFTEAVHEKSVDNILSYWRRAIFSGRDIPPQQLGSDEEVLEFIRHNAGAVGYVSGETPLGDGVKVLEITE